MKVAILSTVNMKHMTIVSIYTEYLKKNNIPYDLIYIDKYGEEEKNEAVNCYKYQLRINRAWNPVKKAIYYWKFRSFAIPILMKNNYDFIITWNMLTVLMFGHFLSKNFNNRFCLNIRDIGTKGNLLFRIVQKEAVKHCRFATVSSPGFIPYLPKYNYTFMQSLNSAMLEKCVPHKELKEIGSPIIITYIGYVCYYENCYNIISALANDNRFLLQFFGEGSAKIDEYAKKIGAKNVVCKGRFQAEDTPELIQNSDIIYNLYGNDNINLRTALSIKMYYSIYLRVPILVCQDTYMKTLADEIGIGITINGFDDNLGDYIYDQYHQMNQERITEGCINYLKKVNECNNQLYDILNNTLNP